MTHRSSFRCGRIYGQGRSVITYRRDRAKAIVDPEDRNLREDEVLLEEFKLVVFHRSHTSPLPRLRKHLA